MASQTPIVIQNENLHIHRGKGIADAKVDVLKSEQRTRKGRKALADLASAGKNSISAASKVPLKGKSVILKGDKTKVTTKIQALPNEQINEWKEWAKEGIEDTHFTGTDAYNLQKEISEQRIQRKVQKVMSSLNEWNRMFHVPQTSKEDFEDVTKLQLEPVPVPVLPPVSSDTAPPIDLLYKEIEDFGILPHTEYPVDFRLKEDEYMDVSI